MGFQYPGGTFIQKCRHVCRVQGCQEDARIVLHGAQQGILIPTFLVGGHSVEILAMGIVPCAAAIQIGGLLGRGHSPEFPLGALFHHVVKPEGNAVRQALDKSVLLRQSQEEGVGVLIFGDKPGHFGGKLIGQAHHCQKLPLLRRKGGDHGSGKHGVDVRGVVRQGPAFCQSPQLQVHGGEPPLAGIEEGLHLPVGERCAAAAGINGQLCVVQPQLLYTDPAELPAQPQGFLTGEKAVTAGYDHMDVIRQTVGKHAQKDGNAAIGQQVKIVDKEVKRHVTGQNVAEIIRQKAAGGVISGAGICPQKGETCVVKGVLYASPKNGEIVGIHADADDLQGLRFGPLR